MAASGRRSSSTSGYLTPWSVSVRTAKEVTSLPVPAVVGIHHRGGWRSENQHIPLAQSIGEPPPKATTASGPKSRSIRTPWATRRREGSGSTWSNISTAPVRRFFTRSRRPEEARNASVTMRTLFPASWSSAAMGSGPK